MVIFFSSMILDGSLRQQFNLIFTAFWQQRRQGWQWWCKYSDCQPHYTSTVLSPAQKAGKFMYDISVLPWNPCVFTSTRFVKGLACLLMERGLQWMPCCLCPLPGWVLVLSCCCWPPIFIIVIIFLLFLSFPSNTNLYFTKYTYHVSCVMALPESYTVKLYMSKL